MIHIVFRRSPPGPCLEMFSLQQLHTAHAVEQAASRPQKQLKWHMTLYAIYN